MDSKSFLGQLFDLSFTEFLTIKIIKVLFVLAIIASALGGLAVMFGMFASKTFLGFVGGLIAGPLVFLLYVILARIWLEIVIVVFRIAENTEKIAQKNSPPAQG